MRTRLAWIVAALLIVVINLSTRRVVAGATSPSSGLATLAPQSAPRTGPGIGDSPGVPGGAPIRLALPSGYALDSIRGGSSAAYDEQCYDFDPTSPPPSCRYSLGLFTATLILRFDPARYVAGQDSNRDQCRSDPAADAEPFSGWLLVSEDGQAQNIWVTTSLCTTRDGRVTPVLDLPTPSAAILAAPGVSTVLFSIAGHCVNLSRSVPGEANRFGEGVATDEPGLAQIRRLIRGKNLLLEESQSVIQDVVWDYSDIDGVTDDDVRRLSSLP